MDENDCIHGYGGDQRYLDRGALAGVVLAECECALFIDLHDSQLHGLV